MSTPYSEAELAELRGTTWHALDPMMGRWLSTVENLRAALDRSEARWRALREGLIKPLSNGAWCVNCQWVGTTLAGRQDHKRDCWVVALLARVDATAAPPAADDDAKVLPTTAEMTRADRGVTGWVEES